MTRTIIVGAGGSGAPLAARLSEDPSHEVIVIEAGNADGSYPPELLDGGVLAGAMPGHPANWDYPAELRPGRPFGIARGRIAGGSTTINGGYFVRARPADFARWADVGGEHWSFAQVAPLLARLETDLDYRDTDGHGSDGPMLVRRPLQTNRAAEAFLAAAMERGFAEEADKNATGPPGVGPLPSNIIGGTRINTAMAYLDPTRGRANLSVYGNTRARRVLCAGSRAVGLETDGGWVEGDEVVLCAGAIGSAHLLLLSGIGPADQLRALGIDVVADLPVGTAFSDHPDIAVNWATDWDLVDPEERFAFPTALNLASGDDEPDGDVEVLLSVKPFGLMLAGTTDSDLPGAADYPLIVSLQAPEGRGRLSLTSADPTMPPQIEYRYLELPGDRARLRTGMRCAADLLSAQPFTYMDATLTTLDTGTLADDDALDAWMIAHLGTAIHMCGTAPMGKVVDGDGRVLGVTGLRVADTSILPDTPHRGPANTAVLIGELIAARMRGEAHATG